jgi:bifunctional DNA-binding transcriptional regulator/antitoxin component of YhaV-PrlF toxin-antitoxin module
MVKMTRLVKQNDGEYQINIPEEYASKLGWRNGHVLQIDVVDEKIVIQKLSGFMGK